MVYRGNTRWVPTPYPGERVVLKTCPILAVVGIAAAAANADRIDLFVFENADTADVSGLDLWVDVVDHGTHAEFVFHNDSTISSFVRSVYIEETDFTESTFTDVGLADTQQAGVKFRNGGSPPKPAGSIKHFGGKWQGNLAAFRAKKPGSGKDGIDAGEQLSIEFALDGMTFDALMAGLTADLPTFRIAQHVQGLPGGQSVWTLNEPPARVVPLPSAAVLSLAGLGIVTNRRRR